MGAEQSHLVRASTNLAASAEDADTSTTTKANGRMLTETKTMKTNDGMSTATLENSPRTPEAPAVGVGSSAWLGLLL